MELTVFLSGEVHSDWRRSIIDASDAKGLPIEFTSAVTEHSASDAAGDALGMKNATTEEGFWRDHKSAKVNAMRIRLGIEQSDVVVVKFGEQYRQWNAAFDAGYAVAIGKPIIVVHPPDFIHALKEIDAAAHAVAETEAQVVDVLAYLTTQR